MVNPNYDPWDDVLLSPEQSSSTIQKNQTGDPWDSLDYDEGFWKNAFRYASQVGQGIASTTPQGIAAGLWQIMAQGEVMDPEEIEHIKMISEREGIPFDEEAYMKAAQTALGAIPTVSNIAREVEEHTGLPLEPKTRGQKALRFFTEASRLSPERSAVRGTNIALPKPIAGAAVTGAKELMQEAGLPEELSEIGSFAILKQLPKGSSSLSVGKSKKPSGMTNRRYEKLNKPTEVSGKKIAQINESVEKEFRGIASDIIEKTPIKETISDLKSDVGFKAQVKESFGKVQELAESLPDTFSTADVKKRLANRQFKQKGTGLTASEYDKHYNQFINDFIKETPNQTATPGDIVKQYRKNNQAYGETFEPGKSKAYNRAKRDALLEYNRTLAEMIEDTYPNTEFSNLFKSTNDQWAKIMDAEAITGFMDNLFDGKIKFEKGKNLLEKEGMQKPFKRALGEQGYKDFTQLTKDLLSTEQANKMLKVAESKGYSDLAKSALSYVLHPKLAMTKIGLDIAKTSYKNLWQSLLDKPQIAVKWDKGVNAFKKGDFKTAERIFKELDSEIKK